MRSDKSNNFCFRFIQRKNYVTVCAVSRSRLICHSLLFSRLTSCQQRDDEEEESQWIIIFLGWPLTVRKEVTIGSTVNSWKSIYI